MPFDHAEFTRDVREIVAQVPEQRADDAPYGWFDPEWVRVETTVFHDAGQVGAPRGMGPRVVQGRRLVTSMIPPGGPRAVWAFNPIPEADREAILRVLQEMALRQELCLTADEPCGSDECPVCIYYGDAERA